MVNLKHELWREPNGLTCLCLAGPMGSDARSLLEPGSELVCVIEGGSHSEVMTKYYELMGWGTYQTDFSQDLQPYPAEWRVIQDSAVNSDG